MAKNLRETIIDVLENTENTDIGFRSCLENLADELVVAIIGEMYEYDGFAGRDEVKPSDLYGGK